MLPYIVSSTNVGVKSNLGHRRGAFTWEPKISQQSGRRAAHWRLAATLSDIHLYNA
jgi:hypothetical protein